MTTMPSKTPQRPGAWTLVLPAMMPLAGLFILYVSLLGRGDPAQSVVGVFSIVMGPVLYFQAKRKRRQ
ncbi:hypothetical protein [Amycolatopsis sp. H20-H5]|uniref:hypothetical protein n=1 Tax=Amycolatopsis sp. H20-H5 TaxID=3046309 RepID=UPI002DBE6324|nr:hypothetical protein [Amycolatopsis sp. H20-H5]MEC3979236.1 hypothetical protein [Amycolatopsis sp. H20-H5]